MKRGVAIIFCQFSFLFGFAQNDLSIPNIEINADTQGLSRLDSIQTNSLEAMHGMQGDVTDSLQYWNSRLTHLQDSLSSLNHLQKVYDWKRSFYDSLQGYDLSGEAHQYIDSLQRKLNEKREYISQLKDQDRFSEIDSIRSKVAKLGSLQEFLPEELDSELLPPDLIKKLKLPNDDISDPVNQMSLDQFLDGKNLELDALTKYLELDNLINADLNFLNSANDELSGIFDFANGFENPLSSMGGSVSSIHELNMPDLNTGDLSGITDFDLQGLGDLDVDINTDEYQKLIEEYGSLSPEEIDQRIDQHLLKMEEMQEFQKLKQQSDLLKSEQMQQLTDVQKYADSEFVKQTAIKKSRMVANDIIAQNFDLVQKAMAASEDYLIDKAKIEKAEARKDTIKDPVNASEILNNVVFGGTFQVVPGETVSLDMSPMLAYKVGNKFILGVGGTFRYEFNRDENYMPNFEREPIYGYRGFGEYNFIKRYFIHGEWERMNVYGEHGVKLWENNILAGLGRDMKVGKSAYISIAVLYNFNADSYSYERPFIIRIGVKRQK